MRIKSIGMVLAVLLLTSGIAIAENLSPGVLIASDTNTPPIITVTGGDLTIERYDAYADAGATAADFEDGNLTGEIITTGIVDSAVVGTYTITYTVTDSQGATDVQIRTVTVEDTTAPADVTDVTVGAVTTNSIELSWDNSAPLASPDFTNVVITVTKASDGSVVVGWDENHLGIVTGTTITGLEAGTLYNILIQTGDDQP